MSSTASAPEATYVAKLKSVGSRLSLGHYTGVVVGLVAICIYMAATQPAFMTWNNWQNIFRSEGIAFVLAIGMTFVILTAGIDLSVGAATACCAVSLGVAVEHGAPWWLGVLAAAGTGLALGLINGFLIGVTKIPFFVVTLG